MNGAAKKVDAAGIPSHVEGSVQAILEMQTEHEQRATPVQKLVRQIASIIGRPVFLAILTICACSWIGINLALPIVGRTAIDPPPFVWLEEVGTFLAVYLAVLILISQRRDDELAERRNQLILQVSMVAEQKTAKIIELLEEMRRDDPQIANRIDPVAAEMASSADARIVLEAIDSSLTDEETSDQSPRSP